ncbi:extracellular solute-binding protein [Bacillus sp. H-16]|uniref:ABC transporter substrate-binding protein n=1 Tax=Alteribacter salitolerans TaxID=2912333 RepID=UPI0019632DB2|nr:extracellular solute-binding protein [Alteribacter salitolerans]MBM7097899.1 extracellular solute-binding protein [Alteribacter salitolerans]
MKKWSTMLSVCSLGLILAACNNDAGTDEEGNDGDEASENQEEVTISVASWRFGNEGEETLERSMVEAFMEDYPHITVEIDESIGDPWNDSLSAAASASDMPDVFELSEVPIALANDWLLSLDEVVEGDEDFDNINEAVKEQLYYEDTVYSLPSGQHLLGYFVNKDLYEEGNLNVPEYGMSIDDFSNAVRDVTDINSGQVGLNQPFSIIEWYPVSANDDMGVFTYQDGELNLDSNEFISGVNLANSLVTNNYVYESLTEEQKGNFNGEDGNEVWFQSEMGLRWDGTWVLSFFDESDFDWDFVGIPGGKAFSVNDFMGISQSTEHPEEAYLFTKYMTFGKEGFLKRLDLVDEKDFTLNTLPITTDQEILDAFFERLDVPGILEAYEDIENGVANLPKIVPGYTAARWNAPTGVSVGDESNATIGQLIDAAVNGEVNIENYSSQLNDLANQQIQEGIDSID